MGATTTWANFTFLAGWAKIAIVQIAQVGVTVQAKRDRVVKRGDFRGQPIHVVLDTVKNEVVTEYFANEWESRIEVRRRPPMVAAAF